MGHVPCLTTVKENDKGRFYCQSLFIDRFMFELQARLCGMPYIMRRVRAPRECKNKWHTSVPDEKSLLFNAKLITNKQFKIKDIV